MIPETSSKMFEKVGLVAVIYLANRLPTEDRRKTENDESIILFLSFRFQCLIIVDRAMLLITVVRPNKSA